MTSDKLYYVGRPADVNRERLFHRINTMLENKWLTNNGPLVQQLEEELASYLEVDHCIAMCNGTTALEIGIRALGLTGEVILPSFTFVATAHALQWHGLTPIFCDIEPNSYCLDPSRIEPLITDKTSGILGVHLYGYPAKVEALQQLADRYDLKLLFDAAHAFGCSTKQKMIGQFGDCEVFSFHATKFFHTCEGGAITTNDHTLAEKIRLMHNFGFTSLDSVECLGINGKMSEINAAMGLTVMEGLVDVTDTNRRNYCLYRERFATIPGITLHHYDETERCNYQYIVAEVETPYPLSRDQLVEFLHSRHILARRYFWPGCHRMEPYHSLYPQAGEQLPITEEVAERIIALPTGPAVTKADIEYIATMCRQPTDNKQE